MKRNFAYTYEDARVLLHSQGLLREQQGCTGESLESIASERGLAWQELAEFNCGSSEASKSTNTYERSSDAPGSRQMGRAISSTTPMTPA